jgi:hypothetical protein
MEFVIYKVAGYNSDLNTEIYIKSIICELHIVEQICESLTKELNNVFLYRIKD